MPTLSLLVGFPASGKSTFVRNNLLLNDRGATVLSTDNIIENIARQYNKTYDSVFTQLIEFATDIFFRDLKYNLDQGYNIIIDRTNLTINSRKKIISLVPKDYLINAYACILPKNAGLWEERLNRPGKTIPYAQILDMQNRYQSPSLEEGIDEIFYVNSEGNVV